MHDRSRDSLTGEDLLERVGDGARTCARGTGDRYDRVCATWVPLGSVGEQGAVVEQGVGELLVVPLIVFGEV